MGIRAKAFVEKVEVAYQERWGYIWATAGEVWTEIKQKNLEDKYRSNPAKFYDYQQGVLYGKNWIGRKVADCSGLVKWALKQIGITYGIYHGSNSQFNKNCVKTGKITKGMKLPIGALIFTGDETTHNHVGVLVTETCVCEARGTQAGVVHTSLSNRKWTYWGLLKNINYDFIPGEEPKDEKEKAETTTKPAKKKHTTLRRGSKGEEVVELQTLLAKDGSTLEIDGIFGIGTMSAVKSFQKRHGLEVDGIVGPKTWAELDKLM